MSEQSGDRVARAWPVAITAGVQSNGGPTPGRADIANAVWSFYTLSVKEDAPIRYHVAAEGVSDARDGP